MKTLQAFCLLIIVFVSCKNQNNHQAQNTFDPKVVEAKGYETSKDSLKNPIVVFVDENKIEKFKVAPPTIVATNKNVLVAYEPKIFKAENPSVIIPGQDSFLLPKQIQIKDSTIVAGIPNSFQAKDAVIKDNNPQNFSSFSKLQGISNNFLYCLLEDRKGNLWLGSYGGGITKYDGKNFSTYTDKDGLPSNNISSMIEDHSGNIWVGTFGGGVAKYDGKYFTIYNLNLSIKNNNVQSLFEDKSGNIWFGTWGGGLAKYDGKNLVCYTTREGLIGNDVAGILQDENGNIWIATGEGLSKFDGNKFYNYTEKQGLPINKLLCAAKDKERNFWFGSWGGGVIKFDGNKFLQYTEEEGLSSDGVYSILIDKKDNLWFGTFGGGASKFDGKYFTHFTEAEGLANNDVHNILQDKNGALWFATYGGGVSKYSGNRFTHLTDKEGLANKMANCILTDTSGIIWIGTKDGSINKYDGEKFTNYLLSHGDINCLLKDKKGNIWIGSWGGGLYKFNGHDFINFSMNEGLSSDYIYSLFEDDFGNIWIGTYEGGLCKYDGKSFTTYMKPQGLSSNSVWCINQDLKKNIWVGTDAGGVCKYDGKNFTQFTTRQGFSNNSVLSILNDNIGNLWFGTSGAGITKFDGKFFTTFSTKEGLVANWVTSLLKDKVGNIWIGTGSGLSELTKANSEKISDQKKFTLIGENDVLFKNFNYDDGLLGIGCNKNAIGENQDGTIWIGTNDRVTIYHPGIESSDTAGPNIQLTSIELFNENISWSKLIDQKKLKSTNAEVEKDTTITLSNGIEIADFSFNGISNWYGLPLNLSLSYKNNFLNFNFIGITQKQNKKVKYKYKLEGLDENWSALTNKTFASYGSLPFGNYTFKVKALNSDGYWSKEFNYQFTIRPPWWKTWWFRSIVVLLIIVLLYSFYRWRTASLRRDKEKLEKTVEERTAELVEEKKIVNEKNKEILDSIEYAKRIQATILPPPKVVKKYLEDSFILYLPKDIVAGDFYWMESPTENENVVLFAACDCTGHGVPGALVSVVCSNALNRTVKEFNITQPAKILDKVAELVVIDFSKDENENVQDGMDASLCALNTETGELQWSGANNPIWIIRNGELIETKANKQPIGKYENRQPFTNHNFATQKGDTIYLITDGYADQFGGDNNKKLGKAKFKELLLSIQHLPLTEQRNHLYEFHNSYRGTNEQVDDILIIGVKV